MCVFISAAVTSSGVSVFGFCVIAFSSLFMMRIRFFLDCFLFSFLVLLLVVLQLSLAFATPFLSALIPSFSSVVNISVFFLLLVMSHHE